MTVRQHEDLFKHLFPGDGLEAAAIVLCGRAHHAGAQRLIVHRVHPVPYDQCDRSEMQVRWKTDLLEPLLGEAERRGLAILTIHCHPNGYPRFSAQDDTADKELFSSVYGWFEDELSHASAVMMPNGRVIARVVQVDGSFETISLVSAVGDELAFWFAVEHTMGSHEHAVRSIQAFGQGTYSMLRRLRIAVIGASGTGSLVIEQLVRSHVGRLHIFDPDKIEDRNLNRIPHTTIKNAANGIAKVTCLAEAARAIGFELEIVPIAKSIHNPEVIRELSTCDIVFGCMDTIDGRALLNRIATFYSMAYFDVGVRLDADGKGGVDQICGAVHYFQPGRSSFFTRKIFTSDDVAAAAFKRSDPAEYKKRLQQKYLKGVRENQPAVMPVNLVFAGLVVMEFFARIHPYRVDSNADYAWINVSLSHGIYDHGPDAADCPSLIRYVGRGDCKPLLDMPDYTELPKAA
jgi:hypothetical protein